MVVFSASLLGNREWEKVEELITVPPRNTRERFRWGHNVASMLKEHHARGSEVNVVMLRSERERVVAGEIHTLAHIHNSRNWSLSVSEIHEVDHRTLDEQMGMLRKLMVMVVLRRH